MQAPPTHIMKRDGSTRHVALPPMIEFLRENDDATASPARLLIPRAFLCAVPGRCASSSTQRTMGTDWDAAARLGADGTWIRLARRQPLAATTRLTHMSAPVAPSVTRGHYATFCPKHATHPPLPASLWPCLNRLCPPSTPAVRLSPARPRSTAAAVTARSPAISTLSVLPQCGDLSVCAKAPEIPPGPRAPRSVPSSTPTHRMMSLEEALSHPEHACQHDPRIRRRASRCRSLGGRAHQLHLPSATTHWLPRRPASGLPNASYDMPSAMTPPARPPLVFGTAPTRARSLHILRASGDATPGPEHARTAVRVCLPCAPARCPARYTVPRGTCTKPATPDANTRVCSCPAHARQR